MTLPCAELYKARYSVTVYKRVTFSKGKLRACIPETTARVTSAFCCTEERIKQRRCTSRSKACVCIWYSVCAIRMCSRL